MEILFLSYADYDFDGRTRELFKVFSELGNIHAFMRSSRTKFENQPIFKGKGYLSFIKEAKRYAKKLKKIDVLVIDNRRAVIPGLQIIKKVKVKKVILDCRELYFSIEVKHFVGKIGCYFEKKCINRADVIIAANKERAEYMDDYYKLKNKCLVFENLRKLEYSNNVDLNTIEQKFKYLFEDNKKIVISTAGCIVDRGNDVLVQNINKVDQDVKLLLVGEDSEPDKNKIEGIIKENHLSNVFILGKVNQNELKYIIQRSDIGIVNYHQKDFNNKFCASGKLFEYIYEGIPVVTTTNPPLKRLCDDYKIGFSDNSYYEGINIVLKNYNFYKTNAMSFGESNTVANNNRRLLNNLLTILES